MSDIPFVSYAQNAEDVVLWRALGHVKDGRYVDVGANHPHIDSVTNAFYERGWRGITIEPLADLVALHRRERPNDVQVRGSCLRHRCRDRDPPFGARLRPVVDRGGCE